MKKSITGLILLTALWTNFAYAKEFSIPKDVSSIGVFIVEGYPTNASDKFRNAVAPDPNLIYDGSSCVLNSSYSEVGAGIFMSHEWKLKNPDKTAYGFKAYKLSSAAFDPTPPTYGADFDIFETVKNSILQTSTTKKVVFINDLPEVLSYLNRPLHDLILHVFEGGIADSLLIVNYTVMKQIRRTRSIATGGYRYSWPYDEPGVAINSVIALYINKKPDEPKYTIQTIEVEKGKMDEEELKKKVASEVEKKFSKLF